MWAVSFTPAWREPSVCGPVLTGALHNGLATAQMYGGLKRAWTRGSPHGFFMLNPSV